MAGRHGSQRFAVLLCKFHGTTATEPHPKTYYESLMAVGNAGLNDYWRAASLGNIDLDGSAVFGWKELAQTHDEFVTSHVGRWDKIQGAVAVFPEANTGSYTGVIAVFNGSPDDSGNAGNGVLCGPTDTNVTFLAHETGHVFGLQHSFDQSDRKDASWSAPGEYFDTFDIMSAMNVQTESNSTFAPAGPLLAAPNLDRMGWLDPARVWTPTGLHSSGVHQIQLVSLGHPEVPGRLAAKIGDLYVEFRTNDRLDAGLSRPAVLIHELEDPNAVVIASDPSRYVNDWQPGQRFGADDTALVLFGGTAVTIDGFDPNAPTATVTIQHVARRPIISGGGVKVFGGIAQDGGGIIITSSGKIIHVPPRSPLTAILDEVANAATTSQHLSGKARKKIHGTAMKQIAGLTKKSKQR